MNRLLAVPTQDFFIKSDQRTLSGGAENAGVENAGVDKVRMKYGVSELRSRCRPITLQWFKTEDKPARLKS